MRRFVLPSGFMTSGVALMAVLALAGCGESAPSVSSSSTEVTVHGTVTYKGKPVTKGTIRFDPANIARREAKATSAPIGEDGKYTIKTLQGENTVGFDLPELAKKDFSLASASFVYDAPAGDSAKDFDLSN